MKSYQETILEIEEKIKTKYLDRYPDSKYIIRFQKTDSPVAIVILTIIIYEKNDYHCPVLADDYILDLRQNGNKIEIIRP